MKKQAKLQAVFFTHRILWGVLDDLHRQLEPVPESIRSIGVATLLVAHNCFEAYLNYAGETLLPELWKDERRSFGSGSYRGLMGKCDRLATELSMTIDKARRPYRTVRELKTWRDRVVHPRIERRERVVTLEDAKYIKNLDTQFFRGLNLSFIDRAIEDIENLCDLLEAAAHRRYPAQFLGPRSFKGILGTTGGSLLQ